MLVLAFPAVCAQLLGSMLLLVMLCLLLRREGAGKQPAALKRLLRGRRGAADSARRCCISSAAAPAVLLLLPLLLLLAEQLLVLLSARAFPTTLRVFSETTRHAALFRGRLRYILTGLRLAVQPLVIEEVALMLLQKRRSITTARALRWRVTAAVTSFAGLLHFLIVFFASVSPTMIVRPMAGLLTATPLFVPSNLLILPLLSQFMLLALGALYWSLHRKAWLLLLQLAQFVSHFLLGLVPAGWGSYFADAALPNLYMSPALALLQLMSFVFVLHQLIFVPDRERVAALELPADDYLGLHQPAPTAGGEVGDDGDDATDGGDDKLLDDEADTESGSAYGDMRVVRVPSVTWRLE
eukprot:PLAT7221.1.p1 GENE.PLAT7221.1~~PLAT7221.1.p1  ORF type:complete len:354 (-),score=76.18 PLAT7221.1:514-1575(-)